MARRERKPGIYQLRNVTNGKIYIGSAVNLRMRQLEHLWMLERGRHPNRHLQSSWNKHGASAFVFEILERVDDESHLIEIEQRYLDRFRPYIQSIGYNLSPTAGSTLGIPCSPEKAMKIGLANKGKVRSETFKALMAEYRAERNRSEEHRRKVSAGLRRAGVKPSREAVENAAATNRERPRLDDEDKRRSLSLKANEDHMAHCRALAASQRKLTDDQVLEMRLLRSQGWAYKDLTNKFGISKSAALRWCRGDHSSPGSTPEPSQFALDLNTTT